MNYNLPGIVKIEVARCAYLPSDLESRALCGVKPLVGAPTETVWHIGMPTLKTEASFLNGGRQEKATLEFKSLNPLPEGENLAFILTLANGKTVIIGTREPNYPVINYSTESGDPSGKPAVISYSVTHLAQKSLIECTL